jgi:hypothetical protein
MSRGSSEQLATDETLAQSVTTDDEDLADHVGVPLAAALSHDSKRWDHYLNRDAYLVKAADFGFCDYNATKETHRALRNKFKPVVLAGQYGQTPEGLAKALGVLREGIATSTAA